MIIRSVRVQNFRSLKDVTLDCEALTVLVGPNDSGKSSLLRALELFYFPAARYTEEDYYDRDTSKPIRITVSFSDLEEKEVQLYAPYVDSGSLSVEKELEWPANRTSQKYYGKRLQNPDFLSVRASGTAPEARTEYGELRKRKEYEALPNVNTKKEIEAALASWESAHVDKCERTRDDGQFFGYTEVGGALLKRFTRFVPVPAVREAAEDATEGKGSAISEILDIVVRNKIASNDAFTGLQDAFGKQYAEVIGSVGQSILLGLQSDLSETLQRYIKDSSIEVEWNTEQTVEVPVPLATVRLVKDSFSCSVERMGHGAQRVFIMTLLEYLALQQVNTEEDLEPTDTEGAHPDASVGASRFGPCVILGIEEPELYQHPSRGRYLAKVLLRLTTGSIPGLKGRMQILYSTHSPLFVDIDRFDEIRRLSKVGLQVGEPGVTQVYRTTLEQVASELASVREQIGGTYKTEALRSRLSSIMSSQVNEGFFSNAVVLVEGEEDKMVLLQTARNMGRELEDMGVSVIPAGGKSSMDKLVVIFRRIGIPVYAVWDNDEGEQNPQLRANHILLKLFGSNIEDYPSKIERNFACFEGNIERVLRVELGGSTFDNLLQQLQAEFNLKRRKNPLVLGMILEKAYAEGKRSPTLEKIIEGIIKLVAG